MGLDLGRVQGIGGVELRTLAVGEAVLAAATALLGDSIATNLFMLGFAFQKGLIPLQEASILKAIELNGVAIDSNMQAFNWGRRAAVSLEQVEKIALPAKPVIVQMPQNLDTLIRRRIVFLTEYQSAAYAKRYEDLIARVRDAEAGIGAGVPARSRGGRSSISHCRVKAATPITISAPQAKL